MFIWPGRVVFPLEPPVAIDSKPGRCAAVKGAPYFGAARRTLESKDRSGTRNLAGGAGGKTTFPVGELRALSYAVVLLSASGLAPSKPRS